jgi:uncharacterized damage-inducible protein DinB
VNAVAAVPITCHVGHVTASDPKSVLHRYLRLAREAMVWKCSGLSEYDLRRPLTATGTNLLGLVKHLASVEVGCFAWAFDRPLGETFWWLVDDAEPNADMWATEDEPSQEIFGVYERARAHADTTIEDLPLDGPGLVPWREPSDVTLHEMLVHMIAETHRHLGQADILRESIDGSVGYYQENDNLPAMDKNWWTAYRDRLERVARQVGM